MPQLQELFLCCFLVCIVAGEVEDEPPGIEDVPLEFQITTELQSSTTHLDQNTESSACPDLPTQAPRRQGPVMRAFPPMYKNYSYYCGHGYHQHRGQTLHSADVDAFTLTRYACNSSINVDLLTIGEMILAPEFILPANLVLSFWTRDFELGKTHFKYVGGKLYKCDAGVCGDPTPMHPELDSTPQLTYEENHSWFVGLNLSHWVFWINKTELLMESPHLGYRFGWTLPTSPAPPIISTILSTPIFINTVQPEGIVHKKLEIQLGNKNVTNCKVINGLCNGTCGRARRQDDDGKSSEEDDDYHEELTHHERHEEVRRKNKVRKIERNSSGGNRVVADLVAYGALFFVL